MDNKTKKQKVYSEHQLNRLDEDDLTYSSMLNHLDIVVRDLVKEGKDVNEVLKMPYHYVLQILDERNTNKVTSDAKADAIFANF